MSVAHSHITNAASSWSDQAASCSFLLTSSKFSTKSGTSSSSSPPVTPAPPAAALACCHDRLQIGQTALLGCEGGVDLLQVLQAVVTVPS